MIGNNINTRGMHGRLKYDTRSRARSVADKLGLDGTHRHEMNGNTIYMPGTNHRNLNSALRDRGLRPTPVPGDDGMMGGMGSPMDAGMMDSGMDGGMSSPMDDGLMSDGMSVTDGVDEMSMEMDAVAPGTRGGSAPTDGTELDPMSPERDDEIDLPDPSAPAGRTDPSGADDVAQGGMMDMRSDVLDDQTDRATDTSLFGGGVGERSEGQSRNVLVGDPDDDDEMELY